MPVWSHQPAEDGRCEASVDHDPQEDGCRARASAQVSPHRTADGSPHVLIRAHSFSSSSRRDAYFSPTHDEDAPRPRVSSEQTPAREPEPVVAPDILAPVREATASPPPADDDVPAPTGTLGAAKIGSRLDCIVQVGLFLLHPHPIPHMRLTTFFLFASAQVVSIRSAANPTVLLVTDFTANPSLEMARHAKAPDGSVFPKEAFGRHVWTVWVDPSVGLKPDMVDELVEGKILHLRGLDVVEGMGNKGLRGNMVRGELEGARVSVTRMPDSDARAKKLLRSVRDLRFFRLQLAHS